MKILLMYYFLYFNSFFFLFLFLSFCLSLFIFLFLLLFSFTPAYYRGEEPFGSSGVSNVLVYVKISGAMTNLQSAFDQAVLVLDEPLGEKAGYVGYTTFRKEWLGKPYWFGKEKREIKRNERRRERKNYI